MSIVFDNGFFSMIATPVREYFFRDYPEAITQGRVNGDGNVSFLMALMRDAMARDGVVLTDLDTAQFSGLLFGCWRQ